MHIPIEIVEHFAHGCGCSPTTFQALLDGSIPQVLANISHLLVQSSVKQLPSTWAWFTSSGEPQEITLTDLRSKWSRGPDGVRLEAARSIAEQLAGPRIIPSPDELPSVIESMLDLRRALPNYFSKHKDGPNCLGKFQLLVALGSLLRVPMLSVCSLENHSQMCNRAKLHLAITTLKFFESNQMVLSQERQSSLERIVRFVTVAFDQVFLQHYAVAYGLESNRWLIIDPNMGLASFAPDYWDLTQVRNDLGQAAGKGALALGAIARSDIRLERELKLVVVNQARQIEELRQWLATNRQALSPELCAEHCYKTLTASHAQINSIRTSQQHAATLQHPSVEFSLALPCQAWATLSHVGYGVSSDIGDAVEMEFFGQNRCQGHLFNLASTAVRQSQVSPTISQEAIRQIRDCTILSGMNKLLLDTLPNRFSKEITDDSER